MQIVIVSYKFLSKTLKYIKIFCSKSPKIDLNTILENVNFGICGCILIKLMYLIFIKSFIVNYFNVYTIIKEDFYTGLKVV